MSQPSSTQSSPHPVLQAALSSLDVQLEVELAQYRCHQTVRHSPPPIGYRASPDPVSETPSNPLASSESATTIPLLGSTHPHLNLLGRNGTTFTSASAPQVELPERASSLTLEAYLKFSQSCWSHSESQASTTKSKFLQRLCSPLAIAAAVSLFLSIPLSYVIILYLVSLTGVNSGTCLLPQAPEPFYFCNSSLGDR